MLSDPAFPATSLPSATLIDGAICNFPSCSYFRFAALHMSSVWILSHITACRFLLSAIPSPHLHLPSSNFINLFPNGFCTKANKNQYIKNSLIHTYLPFPDVRHSARCIALGMVIGLRAATDAKNGRL